MSSCVLNRDKSWLDFSTAKIGKSSFWQIVSQNSTGNDLPYDFNVVNNESRALEQEELSFCLAYEDRSSQSPYFEVFPVHNNVVETK